MCKIPLQKLQFNLEKWNFQEMLCKKENREVSYIMSYEKYI